MSISLSLALSQKRALTSDVFELVFVSKAAFTQPLAGQFVSFTLTPKIRRAYSIAYVNGQELTFIVKRMPNGAGSSILCDMPIGTAVEAMWPLGRFVLQKNDKPKLFIGTGTGFAPLYFQIKEALATNMGSKIQLIFGVRSVSDLFYREELAELKAKYSQFDYRFFVSREDTEYAEKGYITNYLTADNIAKFEEYYICGGGTMIEDCKERLISFWVEQTWIFFEHY